MAAYESEWLRCGVAMTGISMTEERVRLTESADIRLQVDVKPATPAVAHAPTEVTPRSTELDFRESDDPKFTSDKTEQLPAMCSDAP